MKLGWGLDEEEDNQAGLQELARIVSEGGRRLFVAQIPIDLRTKIGTNYPKVNRVYVLDLQQSTPSAAGGQAANLGHAANLEEAKLEKVRRFYFEKEIWKKEYETNDPEILAKFELPLHASKLGVTMPEGPEKIVTGVIDPELVEIYNELVST